MLKEFTQQYQLTAGECNPELEMPLPLLMTRIIEIATLHANSWGVGYAKLIEENQAWVLSRVTIEMTRYPRVNEIYSVTTWIEDYNRHFSLRNMEFKAADGSTLGYARTVWVVINLATRESVDISKLSYIRENVLGKECPIAPQGRLKLQQVTRSQDHTFGYVECDLNRHVNTVRYLELLLNQFPLETYDALMVQRMEIAFTKETRYNETVKVNIDETNPHDCVLSIDDSEGASHCRGRLVFAERPSEG